MVEALAADLQGGPSSLSRNGDHDEQLLLYANDLRSLLEIERGQRLLLQRAYRQTVTALAAALESKDTSTEHTRNACSGTRSCSPPRSTRC